MEKTVERLLNFLKLEESHLTLQWKWGLDATTEPFFKQQKEKDLDHEEVISDDDSDEFDDDEDLHEGPEIPKTVDMLLKAREQVLSVFAVPLSLVRNADDNVVWKNNVPDSPRFCRPLRIHFVKETNDILRLEEENVSDQISTLEEVQIG